jgi:GH3 auxin-responsive promoter
MNSTLRYLLIRLARVAALPLHARVKQFRRLCNDPQAVQLALLKQLIRRQQSTAFGVDHQFSGITTVADYQRQVPIRNYEALSPYIERVKLGETNALHADDRVRFFAMTSGTTAQRKMIPVTDRYLADYKRSWAMWGVRAYYDHRPRDLALRPIVQMIGDADEFRTPAGIPCGNLSGYTASIQRPIARRQYCVPTACARITDPKAKYYLAVRSFIDKPVALFSSANPSTLLTLARTLNDNREALIRDVHDGSVTSGVKFKPNPSYARHLEAIANKNGRLYPQDIWHPGTILLTVWTGGSMGPYLRQLPTYYGDTPVRDLGLVASEGRFTIPFENNTASGVLDILSHFYEFILEADRDKPNPTVYLAHELEQDRNYYILPTTQAGLYRYDISDVVRVTGFLGTTPSVEFLSKGSRFSNLTGEKLSEHHVTQSVEALAKTTDFRVANYTLAPVWDDRSPYYAMVLERTEASNPCWPQWLAALERELRSRNIEYDAKRQSGRLGTVHALIVRDGYWTAWDQARLLQTGGSAEQYKRPCLMNDVKFTAELPTIGRIHPEAGTTWL